MFLVKNCPMRSERSSDQLEDLCALFRESFDKSLVVSSLLTTSLSHKPMCSRQS